MSATRPQQDETGWCVWAGSGSGSGWRLDLDERAADICGSWEGRRVTSKQSKTTSEPPPHLGAGNRQSVSGRPLVCLEATEDKNSMLKSWNGSVNEVGRQMCAFGRTDLTVEFVWASPAPRSGPPSLLIAQAAPRSPGSNGQHLYVNVPLLILACCVSNSLILHPPPSSPQLAPVRLFPPPICCLSFSKSGWCHLRPLHGSISLTA